jgi:hypothetical protein
LLQAVERGETRHIHIIFAANLGGKKCLGRLMAR